MRKCCCCISVHVGATILGLIGFLICLLELAVLVPYLLEIDKETFNPIQENLESFYFTLEKTLKENLVDQNDIDMVLANAREYSWHAFLGAAVESGVYALVCLLMMIGASCQVRGLMVPYLILQMVCIISMVCLGTGVTIGLCFINLIVGVIAGVVVLVVAILLIYFWVAVQKAYVELGNNDYMYSPAPIKPMTQYNDGRGYYPPTSPQHFQMDDRK